MTGQGDKPTGLRRHLEGWQLGIIAITMALLALALALPRPTVPEALPYPNIDRKRLAHQHTLASQRADRRRAVPLPYAVRAVGEAVRRFGALTDSSNAARALALDDLRDSASKALSQHGEEPLADLQALQTQLFLAALRRFEGSGHVDAELTELGGNFVEKARVNGWLTQRGRLLMSVAERHVAFRTRWAVLVGLDKVRSLTPTLVERRLYYSFLMHHPEAMAGDMREDRARRSLSYLSALVKIDPGYPADYARGVLYYEAGMYKPSLQAFERHLSQHPSGPWTLRARNFWLASARQLGQAN